MKHKGNPALLFRLWPKALVAITLALPLAVLYLFHLGRMMPLGPAEAQTAAVTSSLGAIAANPWNLPYKLLCFGFLHLPFGSTALRVRLAAVCAALACSGLFYLLARRWHGTRNALFGTSLFALSSWMLQTGRLGAALAVLSLTVLALIATTAWFSTADPQGRALLLFTAVCSLAVLTPGGLWFVLLTAALLWRQLAGSFVAAGWPQRAAALAMPVISLALAGLAIMRQPASALVWLGIPDHLPPVVIIAKQLAASFSFLVARGPFMPEAWLAHTPVLDAVSTGLLMLGVIFYIQHRQNVRVRLLAGFAVIAILLVTLNGAPALSYLVPLAYLVAATGLAYLSYRWQRVFPRNPIARGLALCSVMAMVVSVSAYSLQRTFVAWRHSPDTRSAYQADGSALKASDLIQ